MARRSAAYGVDQAGATPIRSTVGILRLLRAQADVLVAIVRKTTRRVDQVEGDQLAGKPSV